MAGTWFKRVVWLGIVANFALAVPTLIAPGRMIVLTGLTTTTTHGVAVLKSRRFRIIGAVLLVLAVFGGIFAYNNFFRTPPPPFFASDEDHFLFGSIGTEETDGIPYWIWLVLPRIFPEYLPAPGGYASLGMLSKDGHEMPIGLSKVTIGFERVGINCAICHTASYRLRAG